MNAKKLKSDSGRPKALGTVAERSLVGSELELLKQRLLEQSVQTSFDVGSKRTVRQAADEAAALAWTTPYPTLVFPVLFEEKVTRAEAHAERQDEVTRLTRELLAV